MKQSWWFFLFFLIQIFQNSFKMHPCNLSSFNFFFLSIRLSHYLHIIIEISKMVYVYNYFGSKCHSLFGSISLFSKYSSSNCHLFSVSLNVKSLRNSWSDSKFKNNRKENLIHVYQCHQGHC